MTLTKKIILTESLHEGLNQLYTTSQLCDLTVNVSGTVFHCHRVVLAAVSGFFQCSLTAAWKETATRVIDIDHEDVTAESFGYLLQLLYHDGADVIVINVTTVWGILTMSLFLQIGALEENCLGFLKTVLEESTSPNLILYAWLLAKQYNFSSLASSALDAILKNLDAVLESSDFVQLDKERVVEILLAQTTFTSKSDSMSKLLKAILGWGVHGAERRVKGVAELLTFVDLHYVSPDCLAEVISDKANLRFLDALTDFLEVVLQCSLKGISKEEIVWHVQTRASQGKVFQTSDLEKHFVLVGGEIGLESSWYQQTIALPVQEEEPHPDSDPFHMPPDVIHTLDPVPVSLCGQIATCVWQNELYISGTSTGKTFAVYRPSAGKWDTLPDLPANRFEHAMVAVNHRVFVIGGSIDGTDTEEFISEVLVYSIRGNSWSVFGNLLYGVKGMPATVFGDRIFVLGRCQRCDLVDYYSIVQCLDSKTGSVTEMEEDLPFNLIDYIDVVRDEDSAYIVSERFHVVRMSVSEVSKSVSEVSKSVSEVSKSGPKRTADGTIEAEDPDEVSARVHFETLQTGLGNDSYDIYSCCSDCRVFMHRKEVFICGGSDERESFSRPCWWSDAFSVGSRKEVMKRRTLLQPRSGFGLQTLFLPPSCVREEEKHPDMVFRLNFSPEKLAIEKRTTSCNRKIGNFEWFVHLVQRQPQDQGDVCLAAYLCLQRGQDRNQEVSALFGVRLIPNHVFNDAMHTVTWLRVKFSEDRKALGMGSPCIITWEKLMEEGRFKNKDGLCLIEFRILDVKSSVQNSL